MKTIILTFLTLCISLFICAQNFDNFFIDKTLRVDYIFTGNSTSQDIFVDGFSQLPTWDGRRHSLSELPLRGNGEICMYDLETNETIYKTSFSSLFQEWVGTDEANSSSDYGLSKGFENIFLLPYPLKPALIEIKLFNIYQETTASLKHIIRPDDILIHKKGSTHVTPHKYLHKSGRGEDCIDIAILAEGYTKEEMEVFQKDAMIAVDALFSHEPFKSMKDKFNIVAVESPSKDSGVSIPGQNSWKSTAFGSHFDTFYSARYLTTPHVKAIHNALAGIPYEHIIILANTEQYGGGGIYNSYTLTTAHHPMFRPVVVHEFGHSFGGLADEYFYDNTDPTSITYPKEKEPWEQNITTLIDFDSKWKDMLKTGTPIPTPVNEKNKFPVGVFEGGGYSVKDVFRPADNCRMRTNEYPEFCPVCQRSLERLINFYTK